MNRPIILRLTPVVVVVATLSAGPARGQTWNVEGSGDWNTAGNWSPAIVPNASGAIVNFTLSNITTVNLSASVVCQTLNFANAYGGDYTITDSSTQTLSGVTGIVVGAYATQTETINLGNVATGNLLFPDRSNLTLTNNSLPGDLSAQLNIAANTVIGTPGSGGVIVAGPGLVSLSASFAVSPNNVVGGLTKIGPGLLVYNGNGANLGGGITLNGGTLFLDYFSNPATKISSGALTLDGGILTLFQNQSLPVTQAIPGGTVVNAGHTDVSSGGSGNGTEGALTLAAGAITHNVGGTVDFTPSATQFSIQTSSANTFGLLGSGPAFATVNGGSGWATVSGGTIAALSTYGADVYTSGTNTDVTSTASVAGITTNSLRFNAGSVILTLSGTNTLQSGGILVTPTFGGGVIQGGTLTSPGSGELLVHVYSSNGITINSALVSTAGLTKTGPDLLTLAGNNTGLTGPINVNRGGIDVQATPAVTSASAINFNDDRDGSNLQQFTVDLGNGVNGTISPPIRLSAYSGTYYGNYYGTYISTGFSTGSTVTLSGVISSAAGQTTAIRFTGPAGNTSGFNLTNANTFTGNVSLFQGLLGINSDLSLGNAANMLFLEVGDNVNGGLVFLNSGINVAHPISLSSNTRIVSNGTDSNTISTSISGAGGLIKDGAGTLTLSNLNNTFTGGVTVTAGTLSLGATGGLPVGTNITVAAGATFTPGTSAVGLNIDALTLFGGTFRVSAGSNNIVVNQIVTGPSGGTMDFTGAAGSQVIVETGGGITINGASTWLSPANTTAILNATFAVFPITIPAGVTFNNGIALEGTGFRVTGGGTLFQNSDATNVLNMASALTITQSTFRVTDAASNGGVGNFGSGLFTLDGGTFSYGGTTAATVKPIALTANGATIQVESAATTLTANGAITGPGGLTKIGPGTLALGSSGNSFNSLTVTAGTVQTANDNTLGLARVTMNAAGTLLYTGATTTARTFNLNFGTLAISGGTTVQLNGAAVNGGFIHGPGTFAVTGGTALSGVTTSENAVINQTGAGSFVNFTNGGALTVAAGAAAPSSFSSFTNQGSGAITIAATSAVDAADFQTYGTLTLNPAIVGSMTFTELVNRGTSPIYLNDGSRTFIGTAATAINPATGQPADLAGINLNGQNAVVAGGLFVNNGFVVDGSTIGTATIVADFGSLVKGAGFFQNSVVTQNGGKFQAGNSPGSATFGSFVLGPGGVNSYVFAINDATGTAGPHPNTAGQVSGWGLVSAVQRQMGSTTTPGNFTWTADPADKLTVALDTLVNPTVVGTDVAGPMADFDPSQAYSWPAVRWAGTYSGPTDALALDAATSFDTSGFENPIYGSFGWNFDAADQTLSLTYSPTPVPEPGTLTLTGMAAIGWVTFWRRRWMPAAA